MYVLILMEPGRMSLQPRLASYIASHLRCSHVTPSIFPPHVKAFLIAIAAFASSSGVKMPENQVAIEMLG